VVRPRPVVTPVALAVVVALGFGAGSARAVEPLDRQPYRVRALLAIDPEARFDARRRAALVADWQGLIVRFVGAPWQVEVPERGGAEAFVGDVESLKPEALESVARGVDKVWVIRVSAGVEGSGLALAGREFDATTGRLGGTQRRTVAATRDAPRELLHFALDLFSPYAEVGERSGKDVRLVVRGASVAPASPMGRVVVPGAIFQPLRVVPRKGGGKPLVRAIAYTYLRVEAAEGAGARCSVVSVYGNPLTSQVVQETSLAAIGVKPGKSPTRLRFVTRPDGAPAAGYVLTARRFPDGQHHDAGTTDRAGRITLDPLLADGLLVLRLLAGGSEPMVEFPLMPGHDEAERTVPPFDPKPLAVTLETRLDSLRDAVIDLVAVRARLEARLKARFDGEAWPGAEAALKAFAALTPGRTYADALNRLRDEATRQQQTLRTPVLTRTAQAQLTDLETLIVRYLDDEVFKAYADALAKLKDPPPAKKAAPKPAAGPRL